MKKLKFLLCALLIICSGTVFVACKEENVDFDSTKITVGAQTVTYNGEEQIFSVGYDDQEITVTYSKDGETFVEAKDLDLVNAGTYTIYYKLSLEGYNDYISSAQTFKIEEKAVTVTLPTITDFVAEAKSETELKSAVLANCTFDETLVVDGDVLSIGVNVGEYDKQDALAGDNYTLTATDNDANYQITFVNGEYRLIDVVSVENQSEVKYYPTLVSALSSAKDGDTIKLHDDITTNQEILVNKSLTFDGQNKYTIYAGNEYTSRRLMALETAGKTLTLKNITLDGNLKARVVYINAGTLVIDGATITKGMVSDSFIGGVYVTNGASFVMTSGNITGNFVGEEFRGDGYKEYSADLWIGANAQGELNAEISGGVIGSVFVNSNSYSSSQKGDFTMLGGTIENVYVEYCEGYGAEFVYIDGVVNNLYISTKTEGVAVETTPVKGTTYVGGVDAE